MAYQQMGSSVELVGLNKAMARSLMFYGQSNQRPDVIALEDRILRKRQKSAEHGNLEIRLKQNG